MYISEKENDSSSIYINFLKTFSVNKRKPNRLFTHNRRDKEKRATIILTSPCIMNESLMLKKCILLIITAVMCSNVWRRFKNKTKEKWNVCICIKIEMNIRRRRKK